jgi:EF-hand domain pair
MFFLSQDNNSSTMSGAGAVTGLKSGAPRLKQQVFLNGHSANSPPNRNPPSPRKGTLKEKSSTIAAPSQNNIGPFRDNGQWTIKSKPPPEDDDVDNDDDKSDTRTEPAISSTLARSVQQPEKDVFDAQKETEGNKKHAQTKQQPLPRNGSYFFSNNEKVLFSDNETYIATDVSTMLLRPDLSETNDFSSCEQEASLLWTNSSKVGCEEERFSGLRLENILPSVSRLFGFFSTGEKKSCDDKDDSRYSWRRRHARSLEEGIRFERKSRGVTELSELSSLLDRAQLDYAGKTQVAGRRFIERTLMGLINALAGEVEDLDVTVDGKSDTPFWRKEVNEVRINFSRLGFKPLQMGGCDKSCASRYGTSAQEKAEAALDLSLVESADEAFDRIDVDNSGALDSGEIASALAIVSELGSDEVAMEEFATELVEMYDTNGDGVVDREEYQRMVEDMAALQKARLEQRNKSEKETSKESGPLSGLKKSVQTLSQDIKNKAVEVADGMKSIAGGDETTAKPEKLFGSITLSDLKLDLRRVVFGGIPLLKRVSVFLELGVHSMCFPLFC